MTFATCRHYAFVVLASVAVSAVAAGADTPDGRAPGTKGATPAAFVPSATTDQPGASRRDNPNAPGPNDVVTPDDIIVQGSACIGLDCVNNEDFGFDTLRLKENNTRIKFMDTSTTGFPAHSWQLTANDSVAGGKDKFSIEDITAATVPFTVLGSAPTDALFVAANGKVGLRTANPLLDLHISTTDTPAIRLEQTNAGGFTAQTWDVAGNEANFFVRDLTGSSRLPFRIRPGAPTSSIDIAANGNVGIGTATPAAKLDVAGDMLVHGTISQLSSRTAKEHFVPIDGKLMLAKLDKLPISSWNYRGTEANDRHLGPVAEDFHAAFGLGPSDHFVAPNDVAGVALASVKALQQEVRERDVKIDQLETRLRELEDLVRNGHR